MILRGLMSTKHTLSVFFLALVAVAGLTSCAFDREHESSVEQAILPPPDNVTATPTSSTRITVSWDPVAGAIKYYVYQSVGMAGPFNFINTVVAPGTALNVANLMPGTLYCYQVRTEDGTGPGPFSMSGCATTPGGAMPPPPPATVTATATSSSRITVDWAAEPSATSYRVHQSVGMAGPYNFIGTVTAPTTTLNVANLMANTIYCYKVQSVNGNGTSALSTATGCDKTFIAGLESYWKVNEGSGTVAEDSSGQNRDGTLVGAVSYSTEKAPLDNNPFSVLSAGGTGDAISVPDAAPYWMTGPFSLALWVRIPGPGTDVRFAGKRVAGCGAVNWELAQDAANGLHFKGNGGVASQFGTTLAAGVWTHVAVTYGGGGTMLRKYINGAEVSASAFTPGPRSTDPLELGNSGGCGGAAVHVDEIQIHSRELDATEVSTLGTRPPAPTNLVATAQCATRVNLSWDAVPGASKYFIYKGSMSGNQTYFASVLAPNSTFSDPLLMPGQTTSWFVQSVMNGIFSENSNEQVVTTPAAPAPPDGVTATAISSSRIRVDWNAVMGATKYYVYESVSNGPFNFRGTVLGTNPPTYTATSLTANTMYSYQVRVEVPCAISDFSVAASATTFP